MRTYASFYDIVEGVKEETGISNLVNRYNEFGRLIVRAERDINPYAGHFIKKTVRYKKGTVNFSGTHIKIPNDFIETMGLYDRIEIGRRSIEFLNSNNTHILLCNGEVNESAVLKYWAVQKDPEGNPLVPYNHLEAVVAFIVWKLYSQRTFQNDGSANVKQNYKDIYEQFCKAARGSDILEDLSVIENMRALNGIPSQYEVVMDDCFCSCGLIDDNSPTEELRKVWFWQENSLTQVIVEDDVTDQFLEDKLKVPYPTFQAGTYFTTAFIGRYGLAIQGGPEDPSSIIDALGASIADSVTFKYYPERNLLVLITKNYVTPGSFFLKLTV
jgi:hypothetical protein